MAPNPQLTYLDRVVMEIIETERTYVRDLRMIVEGYLAHIIDQVELSIRPEQVCALFGNIEDIYEFNSELLQDLDLCHNDPVAVARCFVEKNECFEIYTHYCTNYPSSVAALTDCMRNKTLSTFLRDRQASCQRSLPLGSYLLKPVQRILKYHLLLQEIAKHFDPEEEGYEVVEEAIYTMTRVAWYINDMKRRHEHAVRLQEVQSLLLSWKGPDLAAYGELVLEGTFKVHRARTPRTLFLLDRLLLITKRRGEHYVYKAHISCSALMLIESARDALSFSVTHYQHPKQPHTVQAKTVDEKKLWAHHIKRIILENHQAVIPQRAKEAILEMDSVYPGRYRQSPDRLKTAAPAQPQVPRDAGQGRWSSEPTGPRLDSIEGSLEEADRHSNASNTEDGRRTHQETPEQPSAADVPQTASEPEPGRSRHLDPSRRTPRRPEDPTATDEASSATPDSDSKTLSSGESSEDEEDEAKGATSPSILPSSVLDRASTIAQHFFNSVKRGGPAQDDALSLGCPSPRLPSRTGSSLGAESSGRPPRLGSSSSDAPETSAGTDPTLACPWEDGVFDADRSVRRRRDSTLSRQDQLLIGKIRSYYENAGSLDATFGLQRRESLTYIPPGLVRSSVSRFSGAPKAEALLTDLPSPDPDPPCNTWSQVVSSRSLDSLKLEQLSTDSGELLGSRSESVNLSEDEEFRPSSEMIRIWQAMEQQVTRGHHPATEAPRTCRPTRISDLGTVADDSPSPPPLGTAASGPRRTRSLKTAPKVPGEEPVALRAAVPRVAQLRAEAEGDRPSQDSDLDDVDKSTSKVLHLARQYSQRIKTTRPAVRHRNPAVLSSGRSLASVEEEKESPGKPDLKPDRRTSSPPPCPEEQVWAAAGVPPGRGPLSPPPPITGFDWPDVRELCSKYSDRSRTVPRTATADRQTEGGRRRHSSVSSGVLLGDGPSHGGPAQSPGGRDDPGRRLHRTKSLDPRLSGEQASELQQLQQRVAPGNHSCYYIAAEAPRTDDPEHKVIVMEKHREPGGAEPPEDGDGYVQIRSPTSREKISIMAVIDRCRVYQESEEHRDHAHTGAGPAGSPERRKTAAASAVEPAHNAAADAGTTAEPRQRSTVKNLREKFQNRR